MAVVSVGSQRVSIYDQNGAIMGAPVSTGQAGHRTPFGIFSVIQKNKFHESNIYSGAPMPYMQRITWSGIAMHSGALPGYPASHGCIRLPDAFASKLFGMTRMGMRVIVSPNDVTPSAFSHASLPVPLMTPAPTGSIEQVQIRPGVLPTTGGGRAVRVAAVEVDDNAAAAAPKLLNPYQRAQANRTQARLEAFAAVKAAKAALEEAQRTSAEAVAAAQDLKSAQASHDAAVTGLGAAQARARNAAASADPQLWAKAAEALADAEVRLADMVRSLTEAKAAEAVWTPEAFAAAVASREADELVVATDKVAKAADRGVEPITVFISRKEGKLMVRQGFVALFEGSVTFSGQAPLGTHLYTAMAADPVTGRLQWTSISVPNSSGGTPEKAVIKKGAAPPPEYTGRSSNAAEALSRVEIPAEVMEKISDRMWLGGSVIVSDLGISNETGQGTDFVVLTK